MDTHAPQVILEWHAPTHTPAARSNDWYWALGILSICGIVASVLWGNLLFAGIILLAAVMLGVIAAREPRLCDVKLTNQGISIDKDFYAYSSIKSFWIDTAHFAGPRLFIATTGILHPHIGIALTAPAEPEHIRPHLKQHLPEEPFGSAGMLFAEFLGL